jgi:hypothetical protein
MKIALCLSGQPRNLEKNIPYLLNGLVKPSNITDIFIHSWFDESLIGTDFNSSQPFQNGKLGSFSKETVKLLKSLNAKKCIIEKPNNFLEFSHLENLPTAIQTHIASSLYSAYLCNNLKIQYEKENNFEYDLVIKTRIDCFYKEPVNIINYLDNQWKNVIHVAYDYQHMRENEYYPISNGDKYIALSDTFAYGSSEIINQYCSIFPEFENIFYKIYPYQYAECYYGYQTTYKNKINVSMQDIKYNLSR